MAKRKRRPTRIQLKHNRPNLSEWWDLNALDNIRDCINKHLMKITEEAISIAMKDDETGIFWAASGTNADGIGDKHIVNGDNATVKPLTIYLEIALGNVEKNPVYEFDLRTAMLDELDTCRQGYAETDGLKRISAALRKLCDEVDSEIALMPQE